MKILGDLKGDEAGESIELKEVAIMASPHELRVLGHFLLQEAERLVEWKGDYGHTHLQDEWQGWKAEFCDIVIYQPLTPATDTK